MTIKLNIACILSNDIQFTQNFYPQELLSFASVQSEQSWKPDEIE